MTEPEASVTITIPAKQAAAAHIENLQRVITDRNKRIERLEAELAEATAGEPNQIALSRAYKRGWEAAAQELMSSTQTAARSLGKLRNDAFEIYLKGDNL